MRRVGFAVLVTAGALVAASCGSSSKTGSGANKAHSVGVVQIYANPFQTGIANSMKAVATANGASVQFLNSNANAQTEAQSVQNLIAKKVSLILFDPVDPTGSVANAKAATDAGIPIVCYDTCLNDATQKQYVKGFVTSDNTQLGLTAGKLAADYIKKNMGGTAKVGLLTCETIDICKLRRDGINQGLASVNVTIVASQEAYVSDKAQPIAVNLLTAHPEINMIIAENEGGLVGAAAAIKSQGLGGGKVVVAGIDITSQIAQLLLSTDNIVQSTAGQDALKLGQSAMQMALDVLNAKALPQFQVLVAPVGYSRTDPAALNDFIKNNP